jgi:hypothetical protein
VQPAAQSAQLDAKNVIDMSEAKKGLTSSMTDDDGKQTKSRTLPVTSTGLAARGRVSPKATKLREAQRDQTDSTKRHGSSAVHQHKQTHLDDKVDYAS